MQLTQPDLMKQNEPMSISVNGYELEILRVAELSERAIGILYSLPYYRLVYLLEGKLNIYSEICSIELSQGDLCFIRPKLKTRFLFDTSIRTRIISIDFKIERTADKNPCKVHRASSFDIHSRLNMISKNNYITMRDQRELSDIIRAIRAESTSRSAGKNLVIASLYFNFIICGLRLIGINSSVEEEQEAEKDFVMELVKYLRDNIENGITLTSVSQHMNISPRHIARLVKENLGITFHELLQDVRLFYLQRYLRETNLPMQEISERIGYSSPRAAYNLLKKYESMVTNYSGEPLSEQIKLKYDILSNLGGPTSNEF